MRPRNQSARDQLLAVLGRRASASASELADALQVSTPTLHRLLQEVPGQVVVAGRARRTRYALRRPVRGDLADLPLYEVDETGRAELLTQITPVHPQGTHADFSGTGWAVPEESATGWWDGLPYPLHDMRPQGYMGRQFARAEHRQLAVSENPQDWSDDDVLFVLARTGADVSGNLILGNPAYEAWLARKVAEPSVIDEKDLAPAYAAMAERAIAAGVPGSSAAGEFPKFAALRHLPGAATPHVLVKFSGNDDSPPVRRWSDLLVCEHLALECALSIEGIASPPSRIVVHAGRTFLEVERFDRHGLHGRSRLSSLATLNAALVGEGTTDWTRLAARLVAMGLLAPADAQAVERLWWFGRLIANTDMHTGNLSFRARSTLTLAPCYDMLPMAYAPLPGGEVPARDFRPSLPLPTQRPAWSAACDAAQTFWRLAADDDRISSAFRGVCVANADVLAAVASQV
jgi:hypothetical protein